MADQMGGTPPSPTWLELLRLAPVHAIYAAAGFVGAVTWLLSEGGRGWLSTLRFIAAGTLISATLGQLLGTVLVALLARWGIQPTGAEYGAGFALGYSGLRVAGWALAAVRARLLQIGGLPREPPAKG